MSNRKIAKLIKFNEEEYLTVVRRASKLNKRTGTYIREIAVQGKILVFDFKQLNSVYVAMNRIGVNINQIAHTVNSTRSISQQEIEELQKMFEQLESLLKEKLHRFEPTELS